MLSSRTHFEGLIKLIPQIKLDGINSLLSGSIVKNFPELPRLLSELNQSGTVTEEMSIFGKSLREFLSSSVDPETLQGGKLTKDEILTGFALANFLDQKPKVQFIDGKPLIIEGNFSTSLLMQTAEKVLFSPGQYKIINIPTSVNGKIVLETSALVVRLENYTPEKNRVFCSVIGYPTNTPKERYKFILAEKKILDVLDSEFKSKSFVMFLDVNKINTKEYLPSFSIPYIDLPSSAFNGSEEEMRELLEEALPSIIKTIGKNLFKDQDPYRYQVGRVLNREKGRK